jgi:hypothetical protein
MPKEHEIVQLQNMHLVVVLESRAAEPLTGHGRQRKQNMVRIAPHDETVSGPVQAMVTSVE